MITPEQLKHTACLAVLDLDDEQLRQTVDRMNLLLELVDAIPDSQAVGEACGTQGRTRENIVTESMDATALLQNAVGATDGYFIEWDGKARS